MYRQAKDLLPPSIAFISDIKSCEWCFYYPERLAGFHDGQRLDLSRNLSAVSDYWGSKPFGEKKTPTN
jgi:hypothetical protein